MTTLAIIGSGFLGRTLLYTLAKEQKPLKRIILLSSETFAPACSLNSTAIVAPRGLSLGHSPLGDCLLQGFLDFKKHVTENSPTGIWAITQYNCASIGLDNFQKRYPRGEFTENLAGIHLKKPFYFMPEEGFMMDPKTYMDWLLDEAQKLKSFELELVCDFVTCVSEDEQPVITTQGGKNFTVDKVIFTGGNYNRFWKDLMPKTPLETIKPVHGSYLEFLNQSWDHPSFSITLDGDNLIWNKELKKIIIGATTESTPHLLPNVFELKKIYQRLSDAIDLNFPDFSEAVIRTGIREKARKREPYTLARNNIFFMGGMYKNGCSLPVKMANDFSRQYL